jgi:hypothetical protein
VLAVAVAVAEQHALCVRIGDRPAAFHQVARWHAILTCVRS